MKPFCLHCEIQDTIEESIVTNGPEMTVANLLQCAAEIVARMAEGSPRKAAELSETAVNALRTNIVRAFDPQTAVEDPPEEPTTALVH